MPHTSRQPLASLIVFDLDGTLVDSAPQIVFAANIAMQGAGLIHPQDVGPPLRSMVSAACSLHASHPLVDQAVARFAALYDPVASQASAFPGVHEALESFSQAGWLVALATNKRRIPTLSILRERQWEHLFNAGIFCLEDFSASPGGSKALCLNEISARNPGLSLRAMVGDTRPDLVAAQEARFEQFHFAQWGAAEPHATFPEARGTISFSQASPLSLVESLLGPSPRDTARVPAVYSKP